MPVVLALLNGLAALNRFVLAIGRTAAAFALGLMVCLVLYQVVMRYAFNLPPNWTEEGSLFLMVWMTGLIAPLGYRSGGFVAIDMFERALPRVIGAIFSLFLLVIAMLVFIVALQIGYAELTGLAGRFKSASLYYPVWTEAGLDFEKAPRSWMMMSLFVGTILLLMVNVELILRAIVQAINPDRLPVLDKPIAMEGE